MTMQIEIKNADADRWVDVLEREYNIPPVGSDVAQRETKTTLRPGESRSFWIHAARTLTIVENLNG